MHEQQNARSLVESFVQRYSGWDDVNIAINKVTDAILAKIRKLNESREHELKAEREG